MSAVFPVEADLRFRKWTADGGQTAFAVPFPWQDDDDIIVLRIDLEGVETQLANPADYTLTGKGNPAGGTLTLTVPATAGVTIIPVGQAQLDRVTSIVRSGKYNSRATDEDLDRALIRDQEFWRDLLRSLRVALGYGPLKSIKPEAGKVVGFDNDLQPRMFINSAAEAEEAADRAEMAQALAELAQALSEAARDLAQKWAENPEDVPVQAGQFSAKHHALKAAASAIASLVAQAATQALRNETEGFRDQAELAATAATLALDDLYDDTAAGITGTVDGQLFWVKGAAGGDVYAHLWRNVAGVAVDQEIEIASFRAIYDRFRNVADDDYAFRFTDFKGFDYGAFTVDGSFELGKTWLGQDNASGGYLSGRDDTGFVWADVTGDINEIAGFRWRLVEGAEGVEFVGSDGFIYDSTDDQPTSGDGGSGTGETPLSLIPWFGDRIAGFDSEPTTVYVAQLLQYRAEDAHLVEASIVGASGSGGDAGPTLLKVDTGKLGATATLQVRPRKWNGQSSRFLPLKVQNVKSTAQGATPLNFTFCGVGDSIQNGAMTALVAYELSLRGHTMTGTGTGMGDGINNFFGAGVHLAGMKDEGRGGWELADLVFSVNDSGKNRFVGAGQTYATVADYFAASAADQQNTNTMLRPSTGLDPVGDVRNNMIMDIDLWRTRFAEGAPGVPVGRGVVLPHVWGINFLTNDARDRPGGLIQQIHYDNYSLFFRRIRAVSNRPIVCWPVGTPRDPGRDALWTSGYVNGIRGILNAITDAIVDFGDDWIFMHPAFAMNDQNGIGYILRAATPDPDSGSLDTGYSNNVHPFEGARRQMARNAAAAIAFAATL